MYTDFWLYQSATKLLRHENPSPVPSIQSWDVSCFLKVARTVEQHCMEGMGEETLPFPLLKSGKRQKVHIGRSVSTYFVADCLNQNLRAVVLLAQVKRR